MASTPSPRRPTRRQPDEAPAFRAEIAEPEVERPRSRSRSSRGIEQKESAFRPVVDDAEDWPQSRRQGRDDRPQSRRDERDDPPSTTERHDENGEESRRLAGSQIAKLIVLAGVILALGAGTGYAVGSLGPERYAARAEVLYEISQERATGFLREDRSLTTQLVLVRSRSVLEPVAVANGIAVEDLEKQLSVDLVGSSEVIRIEVRDASDARATDLVRAIVDRYLTVTREQGTDQAMTFLQQQLDDLRGVIAAQEDLIAELAGAVPNPADPRVLAAQSELQSLRNREDTMEVQLDELTVAQLTQQRIELLVPGYALEDRVSPRPLFSAAAGGVTAIVVAAFAVLVVARRWSKR